MATYLTYDALKASLPAFGPKARDIISRMTNRRHWRPELDGYRLERSGADYPNFVGILNVYIIEHIGVDRWRTEHRIHLHFGIYPTGVVACITAPQAHYRGAESAYRYLVEVWVDGVLIELQEWASKLRIQTRARAIHEELVAAVWAPARLAAMLEKGGWDLVESC